MTRWLVVILKRQGEQAQELDQNDKEILDSTQTVLLERRTGDDGICFHPLVFKICTKAISSSVTILPVSSICFLCEFQG